MKEDADGEGVKKRNWMRLAACRNYDPEWWDPKVGEAYIAQEAIRICKTECPVLQECGEYAKSFSRVVGVFGGIFFTQSGSQKKKERPKECRDESEQAS